MQNRNKTIIAIVLAIVIISGVYIYLEYNATQNLDIEIRFKSVGIKSIRNINNLTLVFEAEIYNPSNFKITIDKMYYKVYIEGEYVGEGYINNLIIKPNSFVRKDFNITVSTGDLLTLLLKIVFRGNRVINYRVNGKLYIPLQLIGLKIYSIKKDFMIIGNYTIPPVF